MNVLEKQCQGFSKSVTKNACLYFKMSLKWTQRPTKLQKKNILAMEPQEQKIWEPPGIIQVTQTSCSKFHKKIAEKKISSETKKNPIL